MRKHTQRIIHTVAVTTIWLFAVKRKLAIHQRTNTGEEPYNYCHCNKAFGDIQAVLSLAKHRKRQMKMRIPKMFFWIPSIHSYLTLGQIRMRRATEIKILISDALSLIKVCVCAVSGFITLERLPARQLWMALITVPPYLKTISSLEWLGYEEIIHFSGIHTVG